VKQIEPSGWNWGTIWVERLGMEAQVAAGRGFFQGSSPQDAS